MTTEETTLLLIKGAISELPTKDRDATLALVYEMENMIKLAGPVVGMMALALLGAKAQANT